MTRVPTREEAAWLAGIFEGEGCFSRAGSSGQNARLTMTDEDTVRRFAAMLGARVRGPFLHKGREKPMWSVSFGSFEQAQALLAYMWWGLGARRRARAVEVLYG